MKNMTTIVINDRVILTNNETQISSYNAKVNQVKDYLMTGAIEYGFDVNEAVEFVNLVKENIETVKRIIEGCTYIKLVTDLDICDVIECIHANKAETEFFLMSL